ncbi:hypothetical protein Asch01_02038 [Acinetobacter schindleri]|uniref:hypothetical protein n=1 Tax=Acinetobacter schindleri TaxID=108981 RepID=UPI0030A99BD6
MHQTVKLVFRLFLATVIFLVTLALCFTCFAKIQEIMQAEQHYQQGKSLSLTSSPDQQYVLLSNNQKPDHAIFVLIAGNGYISKSSCTHYTVLCSDDFNQSHTRQIDQVKLFKAGEFSYIQQVKYKDSRTGQVSEFSYSANEIQQFYQQDIAGLKYVVFGISLFALAALFVSFKLIRNFRRFLNK